MNFAVKQSIARGNFVFSLKQFRLAVVLAVSCFTVRFMYEILFLRNNAFYWTNKYDANFGPILHLILIELLLSRFVLRFELWAVCITTLINILEYFVTINFVIWCHWNHTLRIDASYIVWRSGIDEVWLKVSNIDSYFRIIAINLVFYY